jgi:AcrR family transcriptional regulator
MLPRSGPLRPFTGRVCDLSHRRGSERHLGWGHGRTTRAVSVRTASSGPRTAPPYVRRRALLKAGWQLWATRGYHEISIEELCLASGMAKGSFYLYFHDKAALLAALMRDEFERIEADVERIETTYTRGIGRLREFATLIEHATADPARARIRADSQQLAVGTPAVQAMVVEMTEMRVRRIQGWVNAAIDSGEFAGDLDAEGVARAFLILCTGIAVQTRGRIQAQAFAELGPVIERLLTGLGTDGRAATNLK